jgi:hypothetical protein
MRLEEHASYTSHLTSSGAAADGASRTTLDPRLAEGAEMGEVRLRTCTLSIFLSVVPFLEGK